MISFHLSTAALSMSFIAISIYISIAGIQYQGLINLFYSIPVKHINTSNKITEGGHMKIRTLLDMEGSDDFDYSIASTDGKGITEIVLDIKVSEESFFKKIAQKHGVDISPFETAPKSKEEMLGQWIDPANLLQTVTALYKALESEGEGLVGRKIANREVKIKDLSLYKLSLYDIMKFCEVAMKKNLRVRFMMY
jgi:hypothetical protein